MHEIPGGGRNQPRSWTAICDRHYTVADYLRARSYEPIRYYATIFNLITGEVEAARFEVLGFKDIAAALKAMTRLAELLERGEL